MKTVMKILGSLVGLFILANGVLFMFNPELVMGHSAISANNAFGMSTVRGLIGGSMVATALLTLIAVIKSKIDLLYPAILVLIGWTVGRIVSIIFDGFNAAVLTGGILISLAMALVLVASHRVLKTREEAA